MPPPAAGLPRVPDALTQAARSLIFAIPAATAPAPTATTPAPTPAMAGTRRRPDAEASGWAVVACPVLGLLAHGSPAAAHAVVVTVAAANPAGACRGRRAGPSWRPGIRRGRCGRCGRPSRPRRLAKVIRLAACRHRATNTALAQAPCRTPQAEAVPQVIRGLTETPRPLAGGVQIPEAPASGRTTDHPRHRNLRNRHPRLPSRRRAHRAATERLRPGHADLPGRAPPRAARREPREGRARSPHRSRSSWPPRLAGEPPARTARSRPRQKPASSSQGDALPGRPVGLPFHASP